MNKNWKPLGFESLKTKARVLQQIRAFFSRHDILEVTTPILSTAGTTDPSIESLSLQDNKQTLYLQTSPEFFMKRLLAAGSGSIYQIAHAYRKEEEGSHHQTEFSLVEWYVLNWDYLELMKQIEVLISEIFDDDLNIPIYTYQQIFEEYAGFNPFDITLDDLQEMVDENLASLEFDALLDYFISIEIMPQLQNKGWFFIKDYPASQASLAKISESNPRVAERFELFFNGIELANGFTELQNAEEQELRFVKDNEERKVQNLKPVKIDQQLIQALEFGLPSCAGVALGLERLLMVLLDAKNINRVGLN